MIRPAALFIVLTIAMTYPVAFVANHRFASGLTDPPFTMWTMAWEARQIEADPPNLYNANIFSLERGTLAYSSLNFAPMLVEYPILRASGNPILAYNFVYLFAWWIIGFSVFLLTRYFRLGFVASIASGVIAEFSSFSFNQIGHLEILWFGWIPLFFLAAHALLTHPTRKNFFLALLFFLLGSLATWYLAIYLSFAAIAFALFAFRFAGLRRSLALGAIIPISWLILFPFALPYLPIKAGFEKNRTLDQAEFYSTHADSYLQVPAVNKTWRGILSTGNQGESNFFPGIVFIALAAFGVQDFWRRGPQARFWVCLGALSLALTLGPSLRLDDFTVVPLPEYLLRFIPGYSLTRVPSRWALFAAIAFAMCAGAGMERIAQQRRGIAIAMVVIALIENLSAPLPTSTLPKLDTLEPEYRWLALQPPTTIVELPITIYPEPSENVVGYMYRSIFHRHALVNGYADYVPAWYSPLAIASQGFPSDESIALFKEHGARFVIVHTDRFRMAESQSLIPTAQFHDTLIYQLP